MAKEKPMPRINSTRSQWTPGHFIFGAQRARASLLKTMPEDSITELAIVKKVATMYATPPEEVSRMFTEVFSDEQRVEAKLPPREAQSPPPKQSRAAPQKRSCSVDPDFPIEEADQFGRYTADQRWRVLFRTRQKMRPEDDVVTAAMLARAANPYLPNLGHRSMQTIISGLDPEHYNKLCLSDVHGNPMQRDVATKSPDPPASQSPPTNEGESKEASEPVVEQPPSLPRFGPLTPRMIIERRDGARRPKEAVQPFSMFGEGERDALARAAERRREAEKDAPVQRSLNVGGDGVGLDSIYRRRQQ